MTGRPEEDRVHDVIEADCGAPTSSLGWRQWASAQIEALCLSAGEANILRLLACRASAAGTVKLGVALMARQMVLSESQVYRLLGDLARRGLMRTRQMGRGRIALRDLVARPVGQLSLFEPASDEPLTAPVVPVAKIASSPRMEAPKPSHQRDPAVSRPFSSSSSSDARLAEDERIEAEITRLRPLVGATQPHLAEVVAILREIPGAGLVDPYVVNDYLRDRPQGAGVDHVGAAYRVSGDIRAGRVGGDVTMLLTRRLDFQRIDGADGAAAPSRRSTSAPHQGRRRAAGPLVVGRFGQAAGVSAEDLQELSTQPGRFNRAAGLS